MFDVVTIHKFFFDIVRMIPSQNSGTTPQTGKASAKETNRRFHLFQFSFHLSPKLLFFFPSIAAKVRLARYAFLKRTKVV